MLRTISIIVLLIISPLSHALLILTEVSSRDNLYQTDWGHPWNTGPNTVGAFSAQPVTAGGSAVDFSPYDQLTINATGFVVDACDLTGTQINLCRTNADGDQLINDPVIKDLYWTSDGLFRGHDVYSLVGIWSALETIIDPISSTFQIGTFLDLIPPSVIGPHYLFLGNNDGLFDDNFLSYTVQINAVIPEPSVLFLLLTGLATISFRRYLKLKNSQD